MKEEMKEETTKDWAKYDTGISYKNRINLYRDVNLCERFYSGDQWNGVVSNGLPTPVLNIVKRIIAYKVSQIANIQLGFNFSIEGIDEQTTTPDKIMFYKSTADIITSYARCVWEKGKQDLLNRRLLLDGAITGDGLLYSYFDAEKETYQSAKGELCNEIIDNVNYIPDDPNQRDVQKQSGIILVFREDISKLKEEARTNGVSEAEINTIGKDNDILYQSGDRAKIEMDDAEKCICLLRLWKVKDNKTGKTTVWYRKSTKSVVITRNYDTGYRRYPLALFNWEERKNSCHGTSEVKEWIPNQIAINKSLAMAVMYAMTSAFGKPIYDKTRIPKWSNVIGEAIGVNGDITNVATYLQPGRASEDIYKVFESLMQHTKESAGANEVALGEIKPDNTSAFIAVSQAVAVPLENIQARFYDFIEDVLLNWLDIWLVKYNTERKLSINMNGQQIQVPFDGELVSDLNWHLKIDVGANTKWSELTSVQVLDNLRVRKEITFEEYLERISDMVVPNKQGLLNTRKNNPVQPPKPVPNLNITYQDLPPDAKVQALALLGIQSDPQVLIQDEILDKKMQIDKKTQPPVVENTAHADEMAVMNLKLDKLTSIVSNETELKGVGL